MAGVSGKTKLCLTFLNVNIFSSVAILNGMYSRSLTEKKIISILIYICIFIYAYVYYFFSH